MVARLRITVPDSRAGYWRVIGQGLAIGGLAWVVYFLAGKLALLADAHAYWYAAQAGVEVYGRPTITTQDAYLYSPAFWQAIYLPAQLPYGVFHTLWVAALVVALAASIGPGWALALLTFGIPIRFWPPWESLLWGNVEAFMVLAVIVGFRYPASWAFLFLTKVTPGIGVLWFAGTREWRKLAIALGVTILIAAVSFATVPHLWLDWTRIVPSSTPYSQPFAAPLWLRVPLAALLVYCGGRLGKRWTVGVAVAVAHPAAWVATLTVPMALLTRELPSWNELRRRAALLISGSR